MEDTIPRLISKRSNDLDFKMTFDFHYRSQVKHPTLTPVCCLLTSTATLQNIGLLCNQTTNEAEESLFLPSVPSQVPPDLCARNRKILGPRLSKPRPRAWELEQEYCGWNHEVAEEQPRRSDIKDEMEAYEVFTKQEYPFTSRADAAEPGSNNGAHIVRYFHNLVRSRD